MTSAKLLEFLTSLPPCSQPPLLRLLTITAFEGIPLPPQCGRHKWKPPFLPFAIGIGEDHILVVVRLAGLMRYKTFILSTQPEIQVAFWDAREYFSGVAIAQEKTEMIGYLRGKFKGQFLGLSKDIDTTWPDFRTCSQEITKRREGKKSNFSAKSVSRPPSLSLSPFLFRPIHLSRGFRRRRRAATFRESQCSKVEKIMTWFFTVGSKRRIMKLLIGF